ncbi:dimethyl sulfoxide reductase [Providencia heimbachae]|uniref:dimethyl sulfoxide reductase anchor subunit family protein n=1 Tax=Providencia heimbachae TaxID=333962 RepID=UPI0010BF0E42|nr:DmsC/YnfH family molybdoenzyme membrane anchor subunit [Providencia heimbachae]QCJ70236.1 dimethyl sulfoxide reductase [Providencia heimbachae]
MSEWPLVTFTLLVQSSVGIVILTALYFCWVEKEIGNQRASQVMKPVLLVAAILGCLGLLASTTHMGYPWNAFHALRHFSSSWLSREIVFAAVYLGTLCLYTLIVFIKGKMNRSILALIGVLGLVDVYCMASLYFNTSMMTWMHANTYFMFFGAVFAAGSALTLRLVAGRVKNLISSELANKMVVSTLAIVFIAIAVRMAIQPFYLEWLSNTVITTNAITFPHSPADAYAETFLLRISAWSWGIIGILLLGFSIWKKRPAPFTSGLPLITLACGIIFLGEVLNRFAYFMVK